MSVDISPVNLNKTDFADLSNPSDKIEDWNKIMSNYSR